MCLAVAHLSGSSASVESTILIIIDRKDLAKEEEKRVDCWDTVGVFDDEFEKDSPIDTG